MSLKSPALAGRFFTTGATREAPNRSASVSRFQSFTLCMFSREDDHRFSLGKYLLSLFNLPGTMLNSEFTKVNKLSLQSSEKELNRK